MPEPIRPDTDAARRIQALIDGLDAQDPRSWPVRVCRDVLNALPLWSRGMDLWALRPDGEILCLDMDSVRHAAALEHDPLICFAAMNHGAKVYPELSDLIPESPRNSRICGHCRGTGSSMQDGGEPSCLACAGMGWIQ